MRLVTHHHRHHRHRHHFHRATAAAATAAATTTTTNGCCCDLTRCAPFWSGASKSAPRKTLAASSWTPPGRTIIRGRPKSGARRRCGTTTTLTTAATARVAGSGKSGDERENDDFSGGSGDGETIEALLKRKNIDVPTACPGCGTALQREDTNGPGFFVVPRKLLEEEEEEEDVDVAEEIKRREKEEKKKKKKKTMTSEGKTPEDWSQLSPDELAETDYGGGS